LERILKFLDGKKTLAGILLFYLAGLVTCWYDSTGWAMPEVIKGLQAGAEYTAYFVGGAGIAHKYQKDQFPLLIKKQVQPD
jgi:hypothetical protein